MVESCSDVLGFHDLFDYYCVCFLMFVFKIKLTMYMYHDILFINKHIVWRSIYLPYIFHLRNSENIQGRGVYGHGV